MKIIYYAVFVLGLVLFVAGCETTQEESSLPWSQPEPWENNIGIAEY